MAAIRSSLIRKGLFQKDCSWAFKSVQITFKEKELFLAPRLRKKQDTEKYCIVLNVKKGFQKMIDFILVTGLNWLIWEKKKCKKRFQSVNE